MKPAFAIIAVVMLGACAGPRPKMPMSASVTPPQAWRADTSGAGDISASWWQAFGDPVLTHLVDAALINNIDIALAASRVTEARGQFHLAKARTLPDVVAEVGGGRERDINPGFGVPESQNFGAAGLSISYDLDLFGQLARAGDAAQAALLSSEASRDNVRLAIAAAAASGYKIGRAHV